MSTKNDEARARVPRDGEELDSSQWTPEGLVAAVQDAGGGAEE